MLVGSATKETTDRSRVTIDFFDWLDPGEGISATTDPVVSLDTAGTWGDTVPSEAADTSPLTVFSATLVDANTKMTLLLDGGTVGLVYLVSFTALGSTSGRYQTVEVRISIQGVP
jgi:hypothetical protein